VHPLYDISAVVEHSPNILCINRAREVRVTVVPAVGGCGFLSVEKTYKWTLQYINIIYIYTGWCKKVGHPREIFSNIYQNTFLSVFLNLNIFITQSMTSLFRSFLVIILMFYFIFFSVYRLNKMIKKQQKFKFLLKIC